MKYFIGLILILFLSSCEERKIEIVEDLNENYLNVNSSIEEAQLLSPDINQVLEPVKNLIEKKDLKDDNVFLKYKLFVNNEGEIEKIYINDDEYNLLRESLLSEMLSWRFEKGLGLQKKGARFNLLIEYLGKTNETKLNFGNISSAAISNINYEDYFVAVEKMPKPIGGIKAIQSNVKYPDLAKRAGVQGRVIVKAFVNEEGYIDHAEVIKGIGAGCDSAAIEAVMKTKFTPGMQRNKPVKVQLSVPIRFKLK